MATCSMEEEATVTFSNGSEWFLAEGESRRILYDGLKNLLEFMEAVSSEELRLLAVEARADLGWALHSSEQSPRVVGVACTRPIVTGFPMEPPFAFRGAHPERRVDNHTADNRGSVRHNDGLAHI